MIRRKLFIGNAYFVNYEHKYQVRETSDACSFYATIGMDVIVEKLYIYTLKLIPNFTIPKLFITDNEATVVPPRTMKLLLCPHLSDGLLP